jgi:polysaccharide biosynthesis/export protein
MKKASVLICILRAELATRQSSYQIPRNSLPIVLLLMLLAGCFGPVQAAPEISPGTATDAGLPLRLAPGDLVDVEVFDTPELSGKLRIGSGGDIDLPVAGKLTVAGLTPIEADAAIESFLRTRQIMLDPHVTTLVTDYPTESVSILGEVMKPGSYLLLGQHSLYEALSQAGGFTERQGATVVITHRSDATHPLTIPVDSPNYSPALQKTVLEAGDVVVVSRADSIFVVGDVQRGGEYPMVAGVRLKALDALALAMGANHTAKINKASILRETNGVVQAIPIDLKMVEENRAPDVILQARDVLVIPHSGWKQFLDYALPSVTGALAGAAGAAAIYR